VREHVCGRPNPPSKALTGQVSSVRTSVRFDVLVVVEQSMVDMIEALPSRGRCVCLLQPPAVSSIQLETHPPKTAVALLNWSSHLEWPCRRYDHWSCRDSSQLRLLCDYASVLGYFPRHIWHIVLEPLLPYRVYQPPKKKKMAPRARSLKTMRADGNLSSGSLSNPHLPLSHPWPFLGMHALCESRESV
jgi:hypothetical protein